MNFNVHHMWNKTLFFANFGECLVEAGCGQFLDLVTLIANQKLAVVIMMINVAADVGVQACDAMHQIIFPQKFQRTIHRRWFFNETVAAQLCQDSIRLYRFMAVPDQLQDLPAYRRQPAVILLA